MRGTAREPHVLSLNLTMSTGWQGYASLLQQYLKNSKSEGMSQVVRRLEDFLPVVSIQVDTTKHVQLGVDPVQPAFDQIWGRTKHMK